MKLLCLFGQLENEDEVAECVAKRHDSEIDSALF
jgi:hypothetical protein